MKGIIKCVGYGCIFAFYGVTVYAEGVHTF